MIEKLSAREIGIIFGSLLIAGVLVFIIAVLVGGHTTPTIVGLETVLVSLVSGAWLKNEVLDAYRQVRNTDGSRSGGNQGLNTRDVLLLVLVIVVSCLIFAGYYYFTYYYVARPIVFY